mmetsp:Transcript_26362/g.29358  ORF Transcript_26362/g.29358 Transcript_26362/m.29358 type:complete len:259 (+) Transcript_26362:128-904(+)
MPTTGYGNTKSWCLTDKPRWLVLNVTVVETILCIVLSLDSKVTTADHSLKPNVTSSAQILVIQTYVKNNKRTAVQLSMDVKIFLADHAVDQTLVQQKVAVSVFHPIPVLELAVHLVMDVEQISTVEVAQQAKNVKTISALHHHLIHSHLLSVMLFVHKETLPVVELMNVLDMFAVLVRVVKCAQTSNVSHAKDVMLKQLAMFLVLVLNVNVLLDTKEMDVIANQSLSMIDQHSKPSNKEQMQPGGYSKKDLLSRTLSI